MDELDEVLDQSTYLTRDARRRSEAKGWPVKCPGDVACFHSSLHDGTVEKMHLLGPTWLPSKAKRRTPRWTLEENICDANTPTKSVTHRKRYTLKA